jgi:hypothetical protein
MKFDLVVFETLFMCSRWDREVFRKNWQKVRRLREMDARRVALPQDEFISTDLLSEFVNDMGIDVVFSVAPPSEWPRIYSSVDSGKVKFYQVLAGYLDRRTVEKARTLWRIGEERTIDIGYRTAGRPYPWFGRHGYLKQKVAEKFIERAPQTGLAIDISTNNEDTIVGDDWYKFLLKCKYTLGVEGGTSILDYDGGIHEKTSEYLRQHPEASFEEIEAACFPGLDGTFNLSAISPRHLEACATGTCQILTAGEYNRILDAGRHYIKLEKDFSNLDEVLQCVADDRMRGDLTERAYEDIVASGKYTYEAFVNFVLERSFP